MNLAAIERVLASRHGLEVRGTPRPVGGASSGRTLRLETTSGAVFLKVVEASRAWALEAEADGLAALASAGELAVPAVRACATEGASAYLALDWIDFVTPGTSAHALLGRGLARQHRHGATTFGWLRDTALGAARQPNAPLEDWTRFFAERRLGYQLALAAQHGLPSALGSRLGELVRGLEQWLGGHCPAPALLHGDLWSGNWGVNAGGDVYVFDPSVYFGDREADLAMARLFGGFASEFYAGYAETWPLPAGASRRAKLYELYHLLNHFNLFGAGYLHAIESRVAALEAGPGCG